MSEVIGTKKVISGAGSLLWVKIFEYDVQIIEYFIVECFASCLLVYKQNRKYK